MILNRDIILKGRGSCVRGYSDYRKAKHKNSYRTDYNENANRKYSTSTIRAPHLNKNVASSFSKLYPQFVTGFIDGEGCFSITIARHSKLKIGWGIKIIFSITLHEKDKTLLEQIQNYFGVGKILRSGDQLIQLRIESIKELALIIDHLEKYPLISKKHEVFEAFKQAFNIIKNKEHLTQGGLEKIVRIKASINRGLSDKLKEAFPFIESVTPIEDESLVLTNKTLGEANSQISDPHWLAGFVSAEGCFLVNIYNAPSYKLGKAVSLAFLITQHVRDSLLLTSFEKYLNCGKYSCRSEKEKVGDFAVYKYSDIVEKIIPFFDRYSILGVKNHNFPPERFL